MGYLFTSESVSEGHPDKVADQISDAVLDKLLAFDPESKVACETLVTTGQVVLAGEIKTQAYVDLQRIAREVINRIGYTKSEYMFEGNSCGVFSAIHEQSSDINRGVEREERENQGAGDQGMMFGYACDETEEVMPAAISYAHKLTKKLTAERKNGHFNWLRPDGKSQVTVVYEDGKHIVSGVEFTIMSESDAGTHTALHARAAAPGAERGLQVAIHLDVDLAEIVLHARREREKGKRGKNNGEHELFHVASSLAHHNEDGRQRKPHFSTRM